MDLKKLIHERRTIYNYNNKIIQDDLIKEGIECFLHAPNHKHTQPWKICIVNSDQRQKIINLNIQLKKSKKDLSDIEVLALKNKMLSPSHLLAILQIKSTNEFQSKEDYASLSCGIMNLQLYFWSIDIGTKWSTGGVTTHPDTYKILDIDPASYEIVGFNWAGYFDRTPPKPKKLSYEDVIYKRS